MTKNSVSRRNWMGRGAAGASMAAVSLAGKAAAQSPAQADDAGLRTYNVRQFGAKGDGVTLDTTAIQAAVDACTKQGGGAVLVPSGTFLAGTIELKNHVTLRLAPTARILGSGDIKDYRGVSDRPPRARPALIMAREAEGVTIEGTGTIDGNGMRFFTGRGDATGPGENPEQGYTNRPHLLVCVGCRDLTIRDVLLKDSAYWVTNFSRCSGIRVDGLRIHSRVNPNNDGIHFGGCEHVRVSNCHVVCQDDACALFGSTRDVTITNCTFSTRWSVFRFGGGVAENITVSNCVIHDTFGCPVKMQVGGGSRVENVMFSNLVMTNVTGPIYIGLGREVARRGNDLSPGGVVRNIRFQGIRASVAPAPDLNAFPRRPGAPVGTGYPGERRTCISLTSIDGQHIENIAFSDIHVTYAGGGTWAEAAVRDVPQLSGGEYFECGTLPSYALYARNVRGLTLDNVRFDLASADLRPAVVFDHVEDAAIGRLSAQGNAEAESLIRAIETRDALFSGCRVLGKTPLFLQVEGAGSKDITIEGGDLSKAARRFSAARGAAASAVKDSA